MPRPSLPGILARMDNLPERIFIIGPMGAGKTTVGQRLANLLSYRFIDADHEIETRTGVDIPYIFEREGEAGFRRREAAIIAELSQAHHIVLATGGGAILNKDTRQALQARGLVIYLAASVPEQLHRTRHSTHRPLLRTPDRQARLEALLATREPLYREIADWVIDTDGEQPRHVARRLAERLQPQNVTRTLPHASS